MDKLATLNYRPNRKKPYFVRFYDESGKRTSRAFAARIDAMQFMAEKSGDAKTSHFDISTEEKELVMRLKRECFARGFSLCDMAETFVHLVRNKPVSDYSLGEVRDMYLNDCRDRGLRSSTLAYYTGKLANLCAMYGKTQEEKSYNRASVKNSVSTDEGIQRPKKRSFKESMQRKAE